MTDPAGSAFFSDARQRAAERVHIARLIPAGGRLLVGAALLIQVLAGIAPVAFVVAASRMIAEVPAALRDGLTSTAWQELRLWLVTTGVLFLIIQLLVPLQAYLGEIMRRRVDTIVRDGIVQASFKGEGIAVLEDAEVLDQAAEAVNAMQFGYNTPGAACAGLIALVSRYLQTLLAAGLIGVVFSWVAAVAVLAAALTIRFGYRIGLSVFGRVHRSLLRNRRKGWYFRDLMLRPDAAKEIRVFGLVDWVRDRYAAAVLDSSRPVWAARRRIFYGPYVLYTLVAFVLLGLSLAAAGRAAASGLIGIGSLMMVFQGALTAIRIGGFIAESDVQTEYGMLAHRSAMRFSELTQHAAEHPTRPVQKIDPDGLPLREIRFERVSFGYRAERVPVIQDLDLVITAGRSLAIVGLNGAGKTTLVKLLARLYEPTAGRITVDGIDIADLDVVRWQRRIAAIFQDFLRLELPVRENVAIGAVELLADPIRSDPMIMDALRRAGAAEFVASLPLGLDTPLSRQYQGGTDLSGGQWQRIAIARALLAVDRGAAILILDEPTASLDVRAEVEFFEQFLNLTRGATSIVISHRFSTVRRADRIVVLESGRVIEDGTHEELIGLRGRYAQLFELQAAKFHDDLTPHQDGMAGIPAVGERTL